MANYILRGSVTARNNVGSTYTVLNGGAVTSGTLMGTSGGTGNFVLISTGGGIQDALYFYFTGDVIGQSYMPAYKYGSLYYPYDGQNMEYVASNYTDSNGVYHYRGTVYNINRSTGARNYTMWSWDITIITSPSYATITAPKGCSITYTPVDGEAKTVSGGTTAQVAIYGDSTDATIVVTPEAYYTCTYIISSSEGRKSFSASGPVSWELEVADGDTITCELSYGRPVEIEIIAPTGSAIGYRIGFDSASLGGGTVAAGSSVTESVTLTDPDKEYTLILTAETFSRETFGGWTVNGTVVDAWSNPVTLVAADGGVYSCVINSASEPGEGSGAILCDRYGNVLYADKGAAESHTVTLALTFADTSVIHEVDWSIEAEGGTSAEGELVRVSDGTFSQSATVTTPALGTNKGVPLAASGCVALKPRLIRIYGSCQNWAHEYDVRVTINGNTVYSRTGLSGSFYHTFEV